MTKLVKAAPAGAQLIAGKKPPQKTRGDIGLAGIALSAGYFGDLLLLHFFPHLGIVPGAASVYFSSAVVGLKQFIDSKLDSDKAKALAEQERFRGEEAKWTRAIAVLDLLNDLVNSYPIGPARKQVEDALRELLRDQKLHEASILTDAEWEQSLQTAVAVIKTHR